MLRIVCAQFFLGMRNSRSAVNMHQKRISKLGAINSSNNWSRIKHGHFSPHLGKLGAELGDGLKKLGAYSGKTGRRVGRRLWTNWVHNQIGRRGVGPNVHVPSFIENTKLLYIYIYVYIYTIKIGSSAKLRATLKIGRTAKWGAPLKIGRNA